MPTNSPASPEQVATAITALRAFWKTGRESWESIQATITPKESAPTSKPKTSTKKKTVEYVHGNKIDLLKKEAAAHGLNYDTLSKAWKAARLYTEAQIEELCKLIEKKRTRFGPTHLSRVMAIVDAKKRDKLTKKAIRERWGVTRLERAIQTIHGRRVHVGKKPTVPEPGPELVAALDALCDKWIRWCGQAGDGIPDEVQAAVRAATVAVGKVKKGLAKTVKDSDR